MKLIQMFFISLLILVCFFIDICFQINIASSYWFTICFFCLMNTYFFNTTLLLFSLIPLSLLSLIQLGNFTLFLIPAIITIITTPYLLRIFSIEAIIPVLLCSLFLFFHVIINELLVLHSPHILASTGHLFFANILLVTIMVLCYQIIRLKFKKNRGG